MSRPSSRGERPKKEAVRGMPGTAWDGVTSLLPYHHSQEYFFLKRALIE